MLQSRFVPAALSCMAALLLATPILAQQPAKVPPLRMPALALTGGQWFDGRGFVRTDWYSVGGRLTKQRPARVDVTVDLSGRFVIPPLAEAHNHNLQNRWAAATVADDYLKRGVFYTVQMAAHTEMIAGFRDMFDKPGTPDVLWAEATLSTSDGHPIALALGSAKASGIPLEKEDLIDKAFWAVDSQAALDAKWPKIAESKPKLVKVILVDAAHADENRADPRNFGVLGIDPALLPEIVRRAHGIGARVAAHVDTADDIDRATRAGVDILAHMNTRIPRNRSVEDLRLTDATIAQMKQRGTAIIPTVAVSRYYLARKPEHADALTGVIRDNLTRLKQAGITVLTGSDLWDGSVVDEVAALAGTGVYTRAEALDLATRTTPQVLFPERKIGVFADGAETSLIALEADPTHDLAALETIALAIKQGELLSR